VSSGSSDASESTDSDSSSEEEEKNINKPTQHETVSAEVVTKMIMKPLSEQEMNQLGAKILKAELMGNEVNCLTSLEMDCCEWNCV